MTKTDATDNNEYVLATGESGAKALALQQQYLFAASENQLQKAGLKSGMTVCDIGCGSGEMTEYLAKKVGDNGCVFAIDVSAEQLEFTKNRINQLGLKNVKTIQADIRNIEDLEHIKADIVYSRLVLMHMSDPQKALLNMYAILKPGGILSLQETTWSTISCSIFCPELLKYRDAVIALGKSYGGDFNFGQKMPSVLNELGFNIIEQQTVTANRSIMFGKQLLASRPEVREKLINSKIVTREQIEEWFLKINALPEDDPNACFNVADMTHVLVKKCI